MDQESIIKLLEIQLFSARATLAGLIDSVAGEQRDPEELIRALGKEAPFAIGQADLVIQRIDEALETLKAWNE